MDRLADVVDTTDSAAVLLRLGIAAALGLLVGLQRQHAGSALGGVRTFPILTVFGGIAAILALRFGGAVLAASALALAGVIAIENLSRRASRRRSSGITTEAAAMVMFGVGALLIVGEALPAVVLSGALAFLLHQKGPMHRMVAAIRDDDFRAIMQFVVISLAILPVLPDRAFGPYDTLNPFRSWLMVVLIVGLELGGYLAFRRFGAGAGMLLGGLLGGLVSSTATTVSYARRAQTAEGSGIFAQLVITLASAVAFGRILVEIAAVSPTLVVEVAMPLGIVLATMLVLVAILYFFVAGGETALPQAKNPAALAPAMVFAAIYTVITLASAYAEAELGARALYLVAVVAGLTDVDAITLSTASLAARGSVDAATAWRVILVAALANLAFKLGVVCVLSPRLAPRIALTFGITGAVGGALIALWPA